ncbi:MAG: helix-turn-helix transcriptional regulator [Thiolinea sp.]
MTFEELHLEPLMKASVFHSRSQLETYSAIQTSLNSTFGIQWKGHQADIRLHAIRLGQIRLALVNFGCIIEITPEIPDDRTEHAHITLFYPLRNSGFETLTDGIHLQQEASGIHLCSPVRSSKLYLDDQTQVVMLRIPASLCRESGMLPPDQTLSLHPARNLASREKLHVHYILNNICACHDRHFATSHFQDAWIRQIEQLVSLFFFEQLYNPQGKPAQPKPLSPAAAGSKGNRNLDKLEAYLKVHLEAPISIGDMEKITGYGRSQLHKLCQQHLGVSPIVWLRNLRLEAVHQHLKENPFANITHVALQYGFGHVGRFSGYFHQRFGIYPSDLKGKA